jgi:hypothetical protein
MRPAREWEGADSSTAKRVDFVLLLKDEIKDKSDEEKCPIYLSL